MCVEKRPSLRKGVSPVQWWILTDYTKGTKEYKLKVGDVRRTEFLKPADQQTSSNTPKNTRDNNVDEGQSVSTNMPDTVSTSSSEMQSEKTSSEETNEVEPQRDKIGKYLVQTI